MHQNAFRSERSSEEHSVIQTLPIRKVSEMLQGHQMVPPYTSSTPRAIRPQSFSDFNRNGLCQECLHCDVNGYLNFHYQIYAKRRRNGLLYAP